MKILSVVATLLLASSVATAQPTFPANDSINLSFGLYTNDSPSTLKKQFTPILRELERLMEEDLDRNVTFKIRITKSYNTAVVYLASGGFDFARFGPVSYLNAKKLNDDIKILAIETVAGEKVFYGIIAVREDSDVKTVEDLRGTKFAFGDESSTIGRFLSQKFLMDSGITEKELADYAYLGRHDSVGIAVAADEFDAGALKENTFTKLQENGYRIVELARFPNVTKPWIASSTLDDDVAAALQRALLKMDDPKALSRLKITGFVPGEDSDYEIIRRSVEDNSDFFDLEAID